MKKTPLDILLRLGKEKKSKFSSSLKKLHLIWSYLKYRAKAKNAHGVHSPFVFTFITEVLKDSRSFYAFEEIKGLRETLATNHQKIEIEDLGAGSLHSSKKVKSISQLAKIAGRNEKFGKLLFRIVDFYQPKKILELGTSMGLGTSYLAKANSHSEVVTIEGSRNIQAQAIKNLESINVKNVRFEQGNFDDLLKPILAREQFELIFIDGNHRKEPTINYFEQCLKHIKDGSILIFDDIHWTQGMTEAWEQIVAHPKVLLSIDLFFFGILFFKKDFKEKQHFVLRY